MAFDPHGLNLDLTLAPPAAAPEPNIPAAMPRNLPLQNEQWDIIKNLTKSDVGNHSRLLIPKEEAHIILNELSAYERAQVYSEDGLRVKVLDVDLNREVLMTFRYLRSNHGHVFNGQWRSGFVNPRGLNEHKVIGLRYWRQPGDEHGMVLFKVFN